MAQEPISAIDAQFSGPRILIILLPLRFGIGRVEARRKLNAAPHPNILLITLSLRRSVGGPWDTGGLPVRASSFSTRLTGESRSPSRFPPRRVRRSRGRAEYRSESVRKPATGPNPRTA